MAFAEMFTFRAGEYIVVGDQLTLDHEGNARRCVRDGQYVAVAEAQRGAILHAKRVFNEPAVSTSQAVAEYIVAAAVEELHRRQLHLSVKYSLHEGQNFVFRGMCGVCDSSSGQFVPIESIPMLGVDCLVLLLKRGLMCCPSKSQYDREQRRIRDCWRDYVLSSEIAVVLARGPTSRHHTWAESQLCLIDSGSCRGSGRLVLRPVVRGELGPKFLFDIDEEVVRGTAQLLQPSEAQKSEVADAVRADIRRRIQDAQRPTAPWWDPYQ